MTHRKPFKVCRRSLDQVLPHLPLLTDFGDMSEIYDAFIGSAGFEERVLGIPRHLASKGSRISGPVLLGRYRTNSEDNRHREEALVPVLLKVGADPSFFDADSPEETRRSIIAALSSIDRVEPARILFDVSGASSTLIFSVIAVLASLERPVSLTIGYCSAAHYHDPGNLTQSRPVVQWPTSDLRETGVSDVVTNELYRGIHHDHLPGFVIALPSMYTARLQRCLSHLGVGPFSGASDDGNVYWILPTTDDQSHRWRQDAIREAILSIMSDAPSNADELVRDLSRDTHAYCDIWDYTSCLRHVLEQVDRQEGANSSIIHMGTKVQAIGVALAALGRPEVSLVSARPTSFSAKTYSDGIGSLNRIDIANLQLVIGLIADVGVLDVDSTN